VLNYKETTTMKLTILEALAALHTHWDRATTAVGAHADIDQRWIDGLLGHAVSANHQLSLIGDLAESTVADAARRALVQDCLVLGALALDGVLGYAGDPADVAQPGDPTLGDQVAALGVLLGGANGIVQCLVRVAQNAQGDRDALTGQLEAARMEHTEAMLTKDALAADLQQIHDALDMVDAPGRGCGSTRDRILGLASQRNTARRGDDREARDALLKQLEAARRALDAAHAPGGHVLAVDVRIAALAGQRDRGDRALRTVELLREKLKATMEVLDGNA
jgi:hypothetical protein